LEGFGEETYEQTALTDW